MKKYEIYKDSGVEWIGEIPEGWSVVPLKHYLSLKGRIGWNGLKSEEFQDKSYAYLVTGQDFNSDIVNWEKCYQINKERYDEDPFIQLENGDLLVTKDGTIGKVAKVVNLNKPACLNSGIFVVKQTKGVFEQNYLYWVLVSNQLKEFVGFNSTGSTIAHLYQNVFENMPLTVPPLSEQQAIASYLDHKVGQIDASVSAINTQIDELKSYRQSIISEVVTKGLNPDAKMKDSGVEWIGDIPEGWKISRIKHLLEQSKDGIKIGPFGSALTGKVNSEGEYKVYGQWNIVGKDFNAGKNFVSAETFSALESYHISTGDLFISMMGTVGKCAIIPKGVAPGIMDSHVVKARLDETKMLPKYFEYVYDKDNSNVIYSQIQKYRKGSIMDGLNSTLIKEFVVPFPPLSEQRAIADYLDKKTSEIDSAISSLEAQRDDLNALKQSIISEAVTGKIDLRDWNSDK